METLPEEKPGRAWRLLAVLPVILGAIGFPLWGYYRVAQSDDAGSPGGFVIGIILLFFLGALAGALAGAALRLMIWLSWVMWTTGRQKRTRK